MKKKSALPFVALAALMTITGCSGAGNGDWTTVPKKTVTEVNVGTDMDVEEGQLAKLGFSEDNPLRITLVTDSGTLWDHSFNESAFLGLNQFASRNGGGTYQKNGITDGAIQTAYVQPTVYDTSHRLEAMRTAVKDGANCLVLPGYLFQGAIALAKDDPDFKDVCLLAMDCQQLDDNNEPYEYTDKITSLVYREEQSGFLAGYATVMDGYRDLGFVGGVDVPAVIRYGSGFIQGAAYAAESLKLTEAIPVHVYYAGQFASTPEATSTASSWYANGTEVIFAAGGAVYQSVVAASQRNNNAPWIGVDVNQHADTESLNEAAREACITSAMKNLKETVEVILASYINNDLSWNDTLAGNVVTVGASSDMCKLPTPEADDDPDCWGFKKFTEEEYNEIYEKVKDGEIFVNAYDDGGVLADNNFGVDPQYIDVIMA